MAKFELSPLIGPRKISGYLRFEGKAARESKLRLTVKSIPSAKMADWDCVAHDVLAGSQRHDRGVFLHVDLKRSTPIYRYMPARYAVDIFINRSLRLSAISKWDDPYEAWWHGSLFGRDAPLEGVAAFGSCWTHRRMDEPFWRLYMERCSRMHSDAMPPDLPVRIESTIGQITDALIKAVKEVDAKMFIAPVRYAREKSLKAHMLSLKDNPAEIAREAAHSLFFKRRHFILEKEVRILLIERQFHISRSPVNGQTLVASKDSDWMTREEFAEHLNAGSREVPIDPYSVINKLMIGPVLPANAQAGKELKAKLKKLGLSGKVRQSLIYKAKL